MPGKAEAKHESIAQPKRQSRNETDLGDIDGVQSIIRIDPKTDGAPGEYRRSDIMADGVAGETRQRGDAVGDLRLADGSKRKEVIEGQRAECADHAQRRECNLAGRLFGQRHQNDGGVHALEGVHQRGDGEGDDEEARGDSEPFPADPLLEATPQRGQLSMHSSSRWGGNTARPAAIGDAAARADHLRQKRRFVQSLTSTSWSADGWNVRRHICGAARAIRRRSRSSALPSIETSYRVQCRVFHPRGARTSGQTARLAPLTSLPTKISGRREE